MINWEFEATSAYPAVSLAVEVLTRLQQDLAVRMEEVKTDQVQLKNTVDATAEPRNPTSSPPPRPRQDRDTAAIAAAVASGAKWVPLIPRSEVSIDTLQKTAVSELGRLRNYPG